MFHFLLLFLGRWPRVKVSEDPFLDEPIAADRTGRGDNDPSQYGCAGRLHAGADNPPPSVRLACRPKGDAPPTFLPLPRVSPCHRPGAAGGRPALPDADREGGVRRRRETQPVLPLLVLPLHGGRRRDSNGRG